jgi:hypothetical protein
MRSIVPFALLCLLMLAPAGAAGTEDATGDAEIQRTPVLIELFTSEGCSSCPAADRQIARLVRVQPLRQVLVIALSEHVDYWDSLGWSDPFASAAFTDRQRSYAARLETDVYTPQLVVDGAQQLVGSNRDETMKAIYRAARRPKVPLMLTPTIEGGDSIAFDVTVGEAPEDVSGKFVLWTAVAEDGLVVAVERGENGGRELRHDGVARILDNQGSIRPGETRSVEISLDPDWNTDNLRVVAFLERRRDGRIVGVAASP